VVSTRVQQGTVGQFFFFFFFFMDNFSIVNKGCNNKPKIQLFVDHTQ
jgi:hypothetical protein